MAGVDDRDYLMSARQEWSRLGGIDMSSAMVQVSIGKKGKQTNFVYQG